MKARTSSNLAIWDLRAYRRLTMRIFHSTERFISPGSKPPRMQQRLQTPVWTGPPSYVGVALQAPPDWYVHGEGMTDGQAQVRVHTINDVVDWLVSQIESAGHLYQSSAVNEIRSRFGDRFLYQNS